MYFPIRTKHKEPEWPHAYDDVFDKYITTDDLNACEYPRSNAVNPTFEGFDFFGTSGDEFIVESIEKDEPTDSLEDPQDYWTRTLKNLEEKAASLGARDCTANESSYTSGSDARSPAFNPEYLSLGGCPSPHLKDRSDSPPELPRGRSRQVVRPGTLRRSKTPSGVRKTVRHSKSQPNMMNPSRYRAGFKDVLKQEVAPPMPILPITGRNIPLSPPPSTEFEHTADQTAFACVDYARFPDFIEHEQQLSPRSHNLPDSFFDLHLKSPVRQETQHGVSAWLNDTWSIQPEPLSGGDSRHPSSFNYREESPPISPSFNPWTAAHNDIPFAPMSHPQYPYIRTDTLTMPVDSLSPNDLYLNYDPRLLPPSSVPPTLANPSDLLLTQPVPNIPYYAPLPLSAQAQSQPPQPSPNRIRNFFRRTSPTPSAAPASPRSRRRTRPPEIQIVPLRDADTSPTRTTRQSQRSKSTTAARTPRTPRSASSTGGFVHFTAHDSAKLLTGVAPSGSSKTKARREKEAQDRRRKLSEAAVKAVIEAGGDVRTLKTAGLVV